MRFKTFILAIITIIATTAPGVSRAACTDPAGGTGEIVYNTDARAMQYCNGSDWIGFPKKPRTCVPGTWSPSSAPANNIWENVVYGGGQFVAVSQNGTNRVMTSPDGVTWTARSAAAANTWEAVAYGNGIYVAMSSDGTNRVMTSPDGINWTSRSAVSSGWNSVIYAGGQFVAVAWGGTNRVMTSPDGITWTARTAAAATGWQDVTYGNGQYVAVSWDGTNRAMTSPDGITWTPASTPTKGWDSVTFGGGQFVAVGGGDGIMTSPDGVNWTLRAPPEPIGTIASVAYGDGMFVAVSNDSWTKPLITSPDGITWTAHAVPFREYGNVIYGNGKWVALTWDETVNPVLSASCAGSSGGNCSVVGDICGDGTIYAGLSPDGNVPMYATRCDAGQTYSGGPAAPAAGLVHHWQFEEAGSGPFVDSIGSVSCPITNGGSATSVAGKVGKALAGNERTINCGTVNAVLGASKVTMSVWLKKSVAGEEIAIGTTGDANSQFSIAPWGAEVFFVTSVPGGTWEEGIYNLNDTAWHHYALVFDGTQTGNANRLKGYIDGQPVSLAYSGTIPAATSGTVMNFVPWAGFGTMDDIRIYNRPLDAAEVQALYAATGGAAACSGTRAGYEWGPAGTDTAVANCTTSNPGAQSSCTTGSANTALLAGLGTGYQAATFCQNLNAHGRSDWYLPGQNELDLMYDNLGPGPNHEFGGSHWYWSSSEYGANGAWDQYFNGGSQSSGPNKSDPDNVRCVRKQHTGQCADPAGTPGELVFNTSARAMQWCDGEKWIAAGPLHPGGPTTGCADPVGGYGELVFNTSHCVLQYCDGNKWWGIGAQHGECAPTGCDNIGDVCSDGTIYAGLSPDGNVPMYAARCDAGQTWNGSNCTGSRMQMNWNNGSTSWTVTGFTNYNTGAYNTAGLTALADAGGPYEAASYCSGLAAHGYSDWYLPAENELALLWNSGSPLDNLDTSGAWYWAGSEDAIQYAGIGRFNDGDLSGWSKNGDFHVRCVRKQD